MNWHKEAHFADGAARTGATSSSDDEVSLSVSDPAKNRDIFELFYNMQRSS